jgi:hypothetical protein
MPDINNKIAYIIAVVNEFSTRFLLCHKNGGALI